MQVIFGESREYRRHLEEQWDDLYRVCYSWCHDPHLSEDLVQETMERALRHNNGISDRDSLKKWLFKVLVNRWRDHCRARKNNVSIEQVTITNEDTPESDRTMEETVSRVYHAMGSLKLEHREILSLVALQGFTYEEISSILDLPVGTVMSRLCRGRKNLRTALSAPDLNIDRKKGNLRRVK